MAKIQLDLKDDLHLEIKEQQLKLERETKKRQSLKEVYEYVIKMGLEALKK